MAGIADDIDDLDLFGVSTGEITEEDLSKISTKDIQKMVVAPTDWTIGVLVDLLRRKKIDLQPNYQRRIAWDEVKMSRFIESLFLRLPVPQVVLAETAPGRFAVIDGKQRVNSIARFCLDIETPLKLQKCEYRHELNGKTYSELERDEEFEPALDAFQSHTVRTIVIKNWGNDELLYLLFLRLNQNSVTLSPQELRRALYPGNFMNWLDDKTSSSPGMAMLFSKTPDFRMRDMDISTRYFAFRMYSELYDGNMKDFLDNTTKKLSNEWKANFEEYDVLWNQYESALETTTAIFGKDAFKLWMGGKFQRSINRAVVDIMTYYFSFDVVAKNAVKHKDEIVSAFKELCENDVLFLNALQTSTKTPFATKKRFSTWQNKLNETLKGIEIPNLPLLDQGELH